MRNHRLLAAIVLLSAGCSSSGRTAPPGAPSAASPSLAEATQSCFLLRDVNGGELRRNPAGACRARVTPASTFKIPHALAALDSGVVTGPDEVIRWDGKERTSPMWGRDHTLASAMRYSVVWYYQAVAERLGPEREAAYAAKLGYGNRDTSGDLRTFWLDQGSLRISPDEQMLMLARLYRDELPVSKAAQRHVREMLVQPRGVVVNARGEHPFAAPWPEGTVVSAKTGSGETPEQDVRWLVGHVGRGARSWLFVTCVTGKGLAPDAAIDLAARALQEEKVLQGSNE